MSTVGDLRVVCPLLVPGEGFVRVEHKAWRAYLLPAIVAESCYNVA